MPVLSLLTGPLLIAATFLGPPRADHLVPDADQMKDEYGVKLQAVFADVYKEEVVLRALHVPSFKNEIAIGMQPGPKPGEFEILLLEPASSVWDTELLRLYATGQIQPMGFDGKPISLENDRAYQELKARSPSDHRKIKVNAKTRTIPAATADRFRSIWVAMLKNVKSDDGNWLGTDGETYHVAATIDGRQVGGSAWSPDKKAMPKSWHLTRLVDRLADYARGSVDISALQRTLEEAQLAIRP